MSNEKTLRERLAAIAEETAKMDAVRAKKKTKRDAPYRPSIVTFFDILGFRALIKIMSAKEIEEILAELRDWSSGDLDTFDQGDRWPPGLAKSIAFSDNIIRVCPVDGEEGGQGALFHELLSLVHIQAKLTERGIFLRGGLTVGNIFLADGIVYGPGLVRAHELESQFAIYPRIVVDPVVVEHYFKNGVMRGNHGIKEDLEYVGKLLRESDDGFYFVDYLKGCRSELQDPVSGFAPRLKAHAAFITSAAKSVTEFTTVKQKYAWLARYHNLVVDETEDVDQDCKVDEALIMFPNL